MRIDIQEKTIHLNSNYFDLGFQVERKLTQEEIMAEAKLTERLNLASLKKYEEMELEAKRKAMRSGKREIKGPVIRLVLCFKKVQYHSNQDTFEFSFSLSC